MIILTNILIKNFILILAFITIFNILQNEFNSFYINKYVFRFMIGVLGFWGFLGHIFYSEKVSKSIGWNTNGFQYEIGFCNLALGVLGLISSLNTTSYNFKLATLIYLTIFLEGAALVHLYDYFINNNSSINNSGNIILYDIFTPIILIYTLKK
jgi:hypothetical protein